MRLFSNPLKREENISFEDDGANFMTAKGLFFARSNCTLQRINYIIYQTKMAYLLTFPIFFTRFLDR